MHSFSNKYFSNNSTARSQLFHLLLLLNYSAYTTVTTPQDIDQQTPITYGYSHFMHFKTVATEVEIQCLSTLIMFPSLLPQFGSAFFSSKEGGVPVLLSI